MVIRRTFLRTFINFIGYQIFTYVKNKEYELREKDRVKIHGPFVVQISQKTNADFVTGYTLNLCKIHISVVPYNQKIRKRGD